MTEKEPKTYCPRCGSEKIYKDGLRYTQNGTVQRWLCRSCGYRFSNLNKFQHVEKVDTLILNSPEAIIIKRQGSSEASSRAPTSLGMLVQTLAEVDNPSKSGLAGAKRSLIPLSMQKSLNTLGG